MTPGRMLMEQYIKFWCTSGKLEEKRWRKSQVVPSGIILLLVREPKVRCTLWIDAVFSIFRRVE